MRLVQRYEIYEMSNGVQLRMAVLAKEQAGGLLPLSLILTNKIHAHAGGKNAEV